MDGICYRKPANSVVASVDRTIELAVRSQATSTAVRRRRWLLTAAAVPRSTSSKDAIVTIDDGLMRTAIVADRPLPKRTALPEYARIDDDVDYFCVYMGRRSTRRLLI